MSTRNIRLVVAVVALVTVMGLLITSRGGINDQIQKVKGKAGDSIPFSYEEQPDSLQGMGHKGVEAPYSAEGTQKTGGKTGSGTKNLKPIVADTSDSLKSHADKSKAGPVNDEYKGQGTEAAEVDGVTEGDDSKEVQGAEDPITGEIYNEASEKSKTKGKSKGKPSGNCDERNFVVMIDAGSTGSRVHVYEFNTCQSPPVLINEVFEMKKPGLSSFDTDTVGAAKSLDDLLNVAINTVPKDKQLCTPVAVKATAGLRLLGEEKSGNILKEVRHHLQQDYPFAVVDGDGVSIMEGKDEGVYAWITTNYLLGNIGSAEKVPTAAVFDLGGGSTQIVFEPEFGENEVMLDGDHKYKLSFGNRDFVLYQYSHLGYGLMEGRNKINGLVIQSELNKNNKQLVSSKKSSKSDFSEDAKAEVTLNNPCIPPGVTAENVIVQYKEDEAYLVNMKGPNEETSLNAGAQCRFLAEKVLNKESECNEKPCSFNGIYQPSLSKTITEANDMYVFSYFYDRTNPLGFPTSFSVKELMDLAKTVCGGDEFWSQVLLDDGVKQLNEEPQWCMDLSFIAGMLHTGYDIPLSRELKTAKTINDNELGWCLGASLPLLDKSSGWKCRVEEMGIGAGEDVVKEK